MQGLAEDRTCSLGRCKSLLAPGTHPLPRESGGLQVLNYSQLEMDSFRGERPFAIVIPFGLIP